MLRTPSSLLVSVLALTTLLTGCVGIQPKANPSYSVEQIPFRDDNFKACVLEQGISDPAKITQLDCSLRNIQSADELFYFPNLEQLDLGLNEISWLDLRANTKLKSLRVFPSSYLKAAKFSQYPQLTHLSLDGLDGDIAVDAFAAMPVLEEVTLGFENLTALEIEQPKLRKLSFINTKSLKKLYLYTPELEDFYSDRSQIKWLDLSSTQKLVSLEVRKAPLQRLTLDEQPNLKKLWLQEGQLKEVNLGATPKLKQLVISRHQLESIDLSQAPALQEIDLDHNQLTALDLNAQRNLTRLYVKNNPLPDLYGELGNSSLFLYCIDANTLDYTVEVFSLNCRTGSDLKADAFKPLNNLRRLILRLPKGVDKLDLSHQTGLEILDISSNNRSLKQLKVPASPYLTEIDLDDNQLEKIDLPELPALEELDLLGNRLTEVELRTFPKLKELSLTRNPLKSVQVAPQPNLEILFINQTPLKTLKLTDQPKLERLILSVGEFRKLELDLPALKLLDLRWNNDLKPENKHYSHATKLALNLPTTQPEPETQEAKPEAEGQTEADQPMAAN